MSYHKARPDKDVRPDPTQPASTVMHNGRIAAPHAEIDGKPILGGLQNAVVDGTAPSAEEEKELVKAYNEGREKTKKAHDKYFDKKTGAPKTQVVEFESDPTGDAHAAPADGPPATPEEVKKNAEAEKKLDNKVEIKPDVNPVGPKPKVEEKK